MSERPDWMLTDEEVSRTYRESRPVIAGLETHVARAIARAQARKLMEKIAKHVKDRAYRIGPAEDVYLDGAFWAQLQKDVGA